VLPPSAPSARPLIQLFVLVPQLVDLGDQLIDLGQPLAQQDFELTDEALPVSQLLAQADHDDLQRVDLSFEFETR
jgi:hypothetical protein